MPIRYAAPLSVKQAAKKLDLHPRDVYRFLRKGVLKRHPDHLEGAVYLTKRSVETLVDELNGDFRRRVQFTASDP